MGAKDKVGHRAKQMTDHGRVAVADLRRANVGRQIGITVLAAEEDRFDHARKARRYSL